MSGDYYQKNYFIFLLLISLLFALTLFFIHDRRYNEFKQYHNHIAAESTGGVSQQVAGFIEEKKRLVELFAEQHLQDIRAIIHDPGNDLLRDRLNEKIGRFFPQYFAFTVADRNGKPYYVDFDGLVSSQCQKEILGYAQGKPYLPYIHPNPEGYHFDVMTGFGPAKAEGVLFISFHADILGGIIRSSQVPGHILMLVAKSKQMLIEVVADGARNHWSRADYRLSDAEKQRVLSSTPVEGTLWHAIDMRKPHLFGHFFVYLWIESAVVFAVFALISLFMVYRLHHEARRKHRIERQKSELMSIITHEFRSPVTAIQGALELVSNGVAGPIHDGAKSMIDIAVNNSRRLSEFVNDFLDMQNIETGVFQLHPVPTDLIEVVRRSIENNKTYAQRFNTHFQLNPRLDDATLRADPSRLEQVMTNLLTNAAKYGADNDTIVIDIQSRDNGLHVAVTDHGAGIPEHFRPRIFHKFSVANGKSQHGVKSTGLGLSIAKAIVEQHGGNMGFRCEQGKGTTFYFDLPKQTTRKTCQDLPT